VAGEDGVNVTWHEAALPVVAAASVQWPPLENEPECGEELRLMTPVGTVVPAGAVSVTVVVHVVGLPTFSELGSQLALVEVGSTALARHSSVPVLPSFAAKNSVPPTFVNPALS
jgi:hypothetical protein